MSDWWAWYAKYLASDAWAAKRERVLARCRGRCEAYAKGKRCTRAATQVHHLTYARVGKEHLIDLIGICRICHKRIHSKRKRK